MSSVKIDVYWEQNKIDPVTVKERPSGVGYGITPLDILRQVGVEGREAFISILMINYRDEMIEEFEAIQRFSKVNR